MLTTGSKNLDSLLGGGVEKGILTQVYGPFATGKTTLAMQIGLLNEGKVVYIDTEGGFSPERLAKMVESRNMNPNSTLQKFLIFEAFDFKEQKKTISSLKKIVNGKFSMIVVDSITNQTPGSVVAVEKDRLIVNTGRGRLAITELQPENKRQMSTAEYLLGHKVSVGDRFGE